MKARYYAIITIFAFLLSVSLFMLYRASIREDSSQPISNLKKEVFEKDVTQLFNKTISFQLDTGEYSQKFDSMQFCTNLDSENAKVKAWKNSTLMDIEQRYENFTTYMYLRGFYNYLVWTIKTNPATKVFLYHSKTEEVEINGMKQLTFNYLISATLANLSERDTTVTIIVQGSVKYTTILEVEGFERGRKQK